ncbi:hypothetical protein [Pleionea sp. CnH1-48]|uniref:hypothetical protein n=1 Tax=Pleionea sp. CnH1-48 TaxID=2954494 RepID=UPI002097E01E|nr:hypothetical protein [Pleionea sp. CnH1-48]MCO7222809.1 hypothetical protein [Pleionea sp. CnH1-48]
MIIRWKRYVMLTMGLLMSLPGLATPIDPSEFNTTGGGSYANGVFTLDGNSAPVASLYLDTFSIGTGATLSFDLFFQGDDGNPFFGRNILSFRVFTDNQWQDLWLSSSQYDEWVAYEHQGTSYFGSYTIDLSAFANDVVAMGWSYISDGPETSYVELSNFQYTAVPEPSLWILFVLMLGWMYQRRLA